MENNKYRRRHFLGQVIKAGTAGALASPVLFHFSPGEQLTVAQVIDQILSEVPGEKLSNTVDTIKAGSGDQLVTGIVTTMFATVKVIEAAAKIKANFIISHEPSFYNHQDDEHWVENNQVVRQKKDLLAKYKITVWRFHDYLHLMKPDGVLHGFLLKTGWLSFNPKEENLIQVPAQPLDDIIHHLKESLGIPHLRFIGDRASLCSIIALFPGASGGQKQIGAMIAGKADLLIVGESSEWETPEYIRDARALGKPLSLIVLGHTYSEEPGMEWLADWLSSKLKDIPVKHIASGEAFTWG